MTNNSKTASDPIELTPFQQRQAEIAEKLAVKADGLVQASKMEVASPAYIAARSAVIR